MEERTKRITLRPNEFSEILKLRESKKTIKDYYNKSGNYQVWLTEREQKFIEDFRDEVMRKKLSSKPKDKQLTKLEEENDNLKELLDLKDSLSNIEIYKLVPKEGVYWALAHFSKYKRSSCEWLCCGLQRTRNE